MKKIFLLLAGFMLVASPVAGGPAFAESPKPPSGTTVSPEQLEERVSAGDMDAAVELGIFYEEEEKDARRASEWYEIAAQQGNARGMHRLGLLYRYGKGVPTNGKKAEAWFLEAANQDYGPAQSALGEIYMDGYVLPIDEQASVMWYTKAAEHGDPMGQYFIGMKYMHGDKYTKVDYRAAAAWLSKSAEQGNSLAQVNLGILYQYGYGVAQDGQKAYQLFVESANQGEMLGQFYAGSTLLGQRDPNFYPQGFEFIKQAADQGYMPAIHMMPDLYHTGKGTPKSAVNAYKWHMVLYRITPSTELQTLAQIKVKMHHLADYMTNRERAEAKANADRWVREYKEKNRIH